MLKDSNYYFLSATAREIWKNDDQEGQNTMFLCLSETHKEFFFRRVIYKTKIVPEYMLTEVAENVFLTTWITFNKKGIAGEINTTSIEYTGFFYIMFKRAYLKALEKIIKQSKEENEFGKGQLSEIHEEQEIKIEGSFSPHVKKALDKISPDCRDLLLWKHIEGLSHDEISIKRKIDRNSSIKMLSRCSKRFQEIYLNFKNIP